MQMRAEHVRDGLGRDAGRGQPLEPAGVRALVPLRKAAVRLAAADAGVDQDGVPRGPDQIALHDDQDVALRIDAPWLEAGQHLGHLLGPRARESLSQRQEDLLELGDLPDAERADAELGGLQDRHRSGSSVSRASAWRRSVFTTLP